jgi:uncharacterized protein (TIGR00725 family)
VAPRAPVIAVVGSASCSHRHGELAQAVGRCLAERGAVLVCGGRGGVMEAACRGAQSAGGLTIGILPGSDPAAGNPFLSVALPTGMGEARNALVALAGQAVIAIGGGEGTLSEIGLAIKAGRKVIGLETWEASAFDGRDIRITRFPTPEGAVDAALHPWME